MNRFAKIIVAGAVVCCCALINACSETTVPDRSATTTASQSERDSETEAVVAVGAEIAAVKSDQQNFTRQLNQLNEHNERLYQSVNQLTERLDRLKTLLLTQQQGVDAEGVARASVETSAKKSSVSSALAFPTSQAGVASWVWFKPPRDARLSSSEGVTQVSQVSRVAQESTGLQATEYVIPSGSRIKGRTITSIVGRIPVGGQVTDPWPFKVRAYGSAKAPNSKRIGVEGMIFEGVAQGDYVLRCVRGHITKLSTVLADGSVVSLQGDQLAWISDSDANPCLPGTYIGNINETLGRSVGLDLATGAARALASAERTSTVSPEGVYQSSVTGKPQRLMVAEAIARASEEGKELLAQRNDVWDAIYVPSQQDITLHVAKDLAIRLDSNKKLYDSRLVQSSPAASVKQWRD